MKWGFGWVFEGVAYRVAEGTYIVSGPGFFNQGGETRFQIFRQKKNGNYVIETGRDLWKAFILELKDPARGM